MSAKIGCENLPKVPGIPAVIRLLDLNNRVEVLLHSALIDVLREAGRLNGVVVGTAEHDQAV